MRNSLYKCHESLEEFKDWAGPFLASHRNVKLMVEMQKVTVKKTSVFFINVDAHYTDNKKEG